MQCQTKGDITDTPVNQIWQDLLRGNLAFPQNIPLSTDDQSMGIWHKPKAFWENMTFVMLLAFPLTLAEGFCMFTFCIIVFIVMESFLSTLYDFIYFSSTQNFIYIYERFFSQGPQHSSDSSWCSCLNSQHLWPNQMLRSITVVNKPA